jgi:hypothetical protein
VADHHRDHRVAAAAAAVDRVHCREDVGRRHARRADALQLGSEHVQQHFGIGSGVEVAAILARYHLGELGGVGEVAVVREADAIGRVDVERLRLGGAVTAGGRIAYVADADVAPELEHVMLLEHVAHQPRALAHAQRAFRGHHDAGGILAAVLQHRQRIIDPLIDGIGANDADDAAHAAGLRTED